MICLHFEQKNCTSCQWLPRSYDIQLADKSHHLQGLLSALDLSQTQWFPPFPSAQQGFRNKAKMVVSGAVERPILGILKDQNERITHVVVMGTGEPFDNYDNVMDFIRILNHPHGLAIGARHITVSTCGLVDKIRQYAHEGLQINLAISLHAPNNEIRNRIMPINHKYDINELMEAVKYYEKEASWKGLFRR